MTNTVRKPFPGEVRTYENTTFNDWWKLAIAAYEKRGMGVLTFGPAHDGYEMGESPETFAEYMLNS
jgi:hypothetical protein